MTMKEQAQKIIMDLPESEVQTALRFLEFLHQRGSDPMLRALASATLDDEPITKEEDEGAVWARKEYERGGAISAEEAKRELLS